MSPSSSQPTVKRRVTGISRKQLVLEVEQKRDKCPETNISPTPTQPEEPMIIDEHESKLSNKQRQMLSRALNAQDATVLAFIMKEHCKNVVAALRKLLIRDIRITSAKLCKRSNGSVLYGNDYDSLKEFSFDKIWLEFKSNYPFLIELMNAVAGEVEDIEDITKSLRIKLSFVYSILMNERWHELNMVKRVNTVLVIDGGCTKQVQIQ